MNACNVQRYSEIERSSVKIDIREMDMVEHEEESHVSQHGEEGEP